MTLAPVAANDHFTVTTGAQTTLTGHLGADNGSGVDRDPEGGPLGWVLGPLNAQGDGNTYFGASFSNGELGFLYIVQSGYVTAPLWVTTTYMTTAAGGQVALNTDGTFTYTAAPGWSGVDSFTYTLVDTSYATSTATVTIGALGSVKIVSWIEGTEGNDTLHGGTGHNTLFGGDGNDIYIVDAAGDVVIEAADSGIDQVKAGVTHTLAANTENLTLTGALIISGTGNALNNRLTGNSGANILKGLGGHDVLNGGAGNDRLEGGVGNDSYVLTTTGDTVIEAAGAGTDLAYAAYSYTLGTNVENLLLTGAGAINGAGNALNNRLTGNSGANILNGLGGHDILKGGAGNDRLEGGTGNDTFVVDAARDVVVEAAGSGTDQVNAAVSWALGVNVENLVLTGSAATNGLGNTLGNRLTGNSGANILKGLGGHDILNGGLGVDRLEGGSGNDSYVLATAGDALIEAAGAGMDQVFAAYSYALATNVENLILTGAGAINGTGNAVANRLTGNGAANVLSGAAGIDTLVGGAGADTLNGGAAKDALTGGLGNDLFVFRSLVQAGDIVTDFHNVSGDNDVFRIDASNFGGGLVAGRTLAASQFQTSTDNLAQDADDRFIWRSTDKTLWFDSNGKTAGGLGLVADLQADATVTYADILLV